MPLYAFISLILCLLIINNHPLDGESRNFVSQYTRHLFLIRIYVSVIRPVTEYACPVWHTNLPKYLSDNIEIIQKRCLKTIFPGYQYEYILQMVNLPTLHRRRDELCREYFAKMKSNDHKLNALLPNSRSVPYALRLCNKLPIPRAKTNRYKNSLIPWCLEHFQIS